MSTAVRSIDFELHHTNGYGVFAATTIATDNPIGIAFELISSGEETVITQLKCAIVIADGCVLDVDRFNGEFVVSDVGHPAFSRMPIAVGRDRCGQLLKIYQGGNSGAA
jgi:hypothetical protein